MFKKGDAVRVAVSCDSFVFGTIVQDQKSEKATKVQVRIMGKDGELPPRWFEVTTVGLSPTPPKKTPSGKPQKPSQHPASVNGSECQCEEHKTLRGITLGTAGVRVAEAIPVEDVHNVKLGEAEIALKLKDLPVPPIPKPEVLEQVATAGPEAPPTQIEAATGKALDFEFVLGELLKKPEVPFIKSAIESAVV